MADKGMKDRLYKLNIPIRIWLIHKLGGVLPEYKASSYRISEVYTTGEKRTIDVKRGRKPIGYNIYGDEILIKFLPFRLIGNKNRNNSVERKGRTANRRNQTTKGLIV